MHDMHPSAFHMNACAEFLTTTPPCMLSSLFPPSIHLSLIVHTAYIRLHPTSCLRTAPLRTSAHTCMPSHVEYQSMQGRGRKKQRRRKQGMKRDTTQQTRRRRRKHTRKATRERPRANNKKKIASNRKAEHACLATGRNQKHKTQGS